MEKKAFKHKGQYELELEQLVLKRFVEQDLYKMTHENVLTLDVTFAYSDEPVPFEEISSLEFKPIKIGDIWAKNNFACAWFCLKGKLPADVDRKNLYLDYSNDGEGLLVDKTGHSIKGFTAGSPVFGIVSRESEKRYYPLDEVIIDDEGNFLAYIDAASNNLVGEFAGEGRLCSAAIVRRNVELQELHWDFDVLLNYAIHYGHDNPNRYKVLYGLRKAMNLITYNVPDWYNKAKVIINELFALEGNEQLKVTAVGHAHLDLAWLWPIRESKRKAKRTFASAIYLLKNYPDFHFVIPQPQQLAWMKELDPKLYEELKAFAKEGRVEIVGGGWVENDTNVPCEESLVRQELYGQKFWKEEFGHYVRLRWLPDTFGYSACLPQVLRLSQQDYFMTIKISWSNRTLFPYHTFHWEGIDGTDVIVHMPPEGTYNSEARPQSLKGVKNSFREADQKEDCLLVYGIGDGGGGPSVLMQERLKRMKDVPYLAKVKQSSAHEYFDGLKGRDLPIYQGEMYLEKHRATYTSHSNNKNYNRDCEGKLIAYEALVACLGKNADKAKVDELWKEVLLYQFHDILPGSSIQRVYDETDIGYANIAKSVEALVNAHGASFVADKNKKLINLSKNSVTKLVQCGDCYLYYKGNGNLIAPVVYDKAVEKSSMDSFTSDYYTVNFDTDGSFKSIVLKNGKTAVENANKLRVFIDRGDSWDFEDDYRDQPELFMQLQDTKVRDFGDVIEIVQSYIYKASKLVQTIVMHKNEPIIQIKHDVNWVDTGHMLRAEFIPTAWSDVAHSDIQFGYLDRPTTDEEEHDRAQFEICCQKWCDVSNETQGFAILNNAKCGYMAKQGIISLDALRSTEYPCKERNGTSYSYALYPHDGGFDPVEVDDLARDFNLRALYGDVIVDAPSVDSEQVEITAFKPAYDGDGYILRMFERSGKAANTKLYLPDGYKLVCEVDLLEEKLGEATNELAFKPFQIRSFKIVK